MNCPRLRTELRNLTLPLLQHQFPDSLHATLDFYIHHYQKIILALNMFLNCNLSGLEVETKNTHERLHQMYIPTGNMGKASQKSPQGNSPLISQERLTAATRSVITRPKHLSR